MEKDAIIQIGGNVEDAIKGAYNINVLTVIKEAWQHTQTSRSAINGGLAFVMLLGMLVSFVVSQYMGGAKAVLDDPQASTLLNILVTMVIWPFLAGVEMMGVFHAVGLKTRTKLVFAFLKRGSWVAVCAMLTSVLISVGFQLFVLPGVFLAVVLSLTIPLVVEKQMSPIKAIVISLQALRFQWYKLLVVYMLLAVVLVVSVLPMVYVKDSNIVILAIVLFFFSLSYLAPMFFHVKGIFYREIFGMTMHTKGVQTTDTDNIFTA